MITSEDEAREFVAKRSDGAGMGPLEKLQTLLLDECERQNLVSRGTL